jgi:ABC-type multidrug transport system fused ATPase/permease subunit
MTEEMLEDMTLEDGDTERLVEGFLRQLEKRVAVLKAREEETGEKGNYYYPVRNAIIATFGVEILRTAVYIFFAEVAVIAFTTFLITLIAYLKDSPPEDPEADVYLGVAYVFVFATLMLAASLLRNEQQLLGFKTAIRSRKCLTAALYTKISRLSVRSLAETNSGKLITIVSGDLQAVTPMMGLVAMIFAAPFVNLVAFLVLGYTSGWQNAGITVGIWFVILICQHLTAAQTRKYKLAEGKHNDER